MNHAYWTRVNCDYEAEILSVWDREQSGCIRESLATARQSNPAPRSAADLGCGVGKFLPMLASMFDTVHACDFTPTGLERARLHCQAHACANVSFHPVDLTLDPMPFDPVDLVLCINVLLMPDLDERLRAWRTVCNQVDHGGWLLLVLPSLESALLEQHLERDALLHSGMTCDESLHTTLPADSKLMELHQGVHRIEGCATKHYLQEELNELLESHELKPVQWHRLRYEDSGNAPHALWDWCVLAQRQNACT